MAIRIDKNGISRRLLNAIQIDRLEWWNAQHDITSQVSGWLVTNNSQFYCCDDLGREAIRIEEATNKDIEWELWPSRFYLPREAGFFCLFVQSLA